MSAAEKHTFKTYYVVVLYHEDGSSHAYTERGCLCTFDTSWAARECGFLLMRSSRCGSPLYTVVTFGIQEVYREVQG
jgi:hypothetical protein